MREGEGSTHLANKFDEGRTYYISREQGHREHMDACQWTFGQRGLLRLAQGLTSHCGHLDQIILCFAELSCAL